MNALLLSRIQFGLTAGFHFIFPPITLGLTLLILILETLYLGKKDDLYKKLSTFLVRILALVFVIGVATGITLEFSFGTNWSQYSRLVGDIFGAPLAAEGVFSFFLESVFLGVLVFGRNRISPRAYWLSAFLVFFASHLSGLWIIIANSWMQTPAGFRMEEGRAILTSFIDAAINHSSLIRYLHVVLAGWITGSILTASIASWYLLRGRDTELAKPLLKTAMILFIVTALLLLGSGHSHSVQVTKTQPAKMAAFEALWQSQEGAPLALFGIPDEEKEITYLNVGIPKLLSLLVYFDPNARILGLNEFPKGDRPPVFLPYASYHIMITLGMLFFALALFGGVLLALKRLSDTKWFLRILLLSAPLPLLASEFGWIAAEVGRQPWAVYGILKTADAHSLVVPAGQILFTLVMFGLIYLLLFIMFIFLLMKLIKKGPEKIAAEGY